MFLYGNKMNLVTISYFSSCLIYCILSCCLEITLSKWLKLVPGLILVATRPYNRLCLIFAVLGDAFLMDQDNYFKLGILSFGVYQFMIWLRFSKTKKVYPWIFVITSVFTWFMNSQDLHMSILIFVYANIITHALISSMYRMVNMWTNQNFANFLGMFMFVISDIMIALEYFNLPINEYLWGSNVFLSCSSIILTYWMGIYLTTLENQSNKSI